MSNPLLRPNDPRFQKPQIRDEVGKNRFGEAEEQTEPQAGTDILAAPATDEARPFVPTYEATQEPRRWLIPLGILGWLGAAIGAVSLTGIWKVGWICPLLGVGPAAAAWLLAHEDLKATDSGAIKNENRPRVLLIFWFGLGAFIACLLIVAAMVYRQANFLPDLL